MKCVTLFVNMKKRKSEIATIVMIGAVVVMGVTAIISSFTQQDKKTTRSMAREVEDPTPRPTLRPTSVAAPTASTSCIYAECADGTAYWKKAGKYYKKAGCATLIPDLNSWCRLGDGVPPTIAPTVVSGFSCTSGTKQTGSTTKTCSDICLNNGYSTGKNGVPNSTASIRNCCCSGTSSPAATAVPTTPASGTGTDQGNCPSGSTKYDTESGCADFCSSKSSTYVRNSQWTDSSGHHCCCTTVPDVGQTPDGNPDDACCLVKANKEGQMCLTLYSPSLSQYGMPLSSCNGNPAYGGTLELCSKYGGAQSGCDVQPVDTGSVEPTVDPGTDTGECYLKKSTGETCIEGYSPAGQRGSQCCPSGGEDILPSVEPTPEYTTLPTYDCDLPSKKKYTVLKTTKPGCRNYCYGTSASNLTETFTEVKNAQCNGNVIVPTGLPEAPPPNPRETPPTVPSTDVDPESKWYIDNCIFGATSANSCTGNHNSYEKYRGAGYCCTYSKPKADLDKIYKSNQIFYTYYNCRYIQASPLSILSNCMMNCKANEKCASDYLTVNPHILCCENKYLK